MAAPSPMSAKDMRNHVVSLVNAKLTEHGITPGSDYSTVLKCLGYPAVEFKPLRSNVFGMRDGRRIFVNETCNRERREFTAFHELMHDLIDEDGHIDSHLLELVDYESNAYHWTLEDLCDLGAAEFLMPSVFFKAFITDRDWKIDGLADVKGTFRCSHIAAAFHFARLNPDPCTVVVCELGTDKRETSQTAIQIDASPVSSDRLIVAYTARNDEGYTMMRSVPVPADHVIYNTWKMRNSQVGKGQGFFRNPKGVLEWEAAFIKGRIYAVSYRGKRRWVSPKQQPTLDFFGG